MVKNRLEAYFLRMAKAAETDDDVDSGTEAEPKNAFARNLARRMTFAGITVEQLEKIAKVEKRRIQTLRSAGIVSPEGARKPDEIKRIADALGCTVPDLFQDESPPPAADPKAEEMLRVALSGPKKSFILDALQMAYVAALTSKSSYS